MFISPAYAQAAGGAAASPVAAFGQVVPIVLVIVIMYVLMIRPQQRKVKEHKAMIEALRRGDQVVTQGGIVGKVSHVREDGELEVEIAPNVKVRVVKQTIVQVLSKTEPAASSN